MPPKQPLWNWLTETRRIKLTISYDGSDFIGWAPQTGLKNRPWHIDRSRSPDLRRRDRDHRRQRTDSGAHAEGQVVHFDTEKPIPAYRWARAIQPLLPSDIAIRSASRVAPDFHSRFWAVHRHYRYRFLVGERDPSRSRYTFGYHRELTLRR